MACRGCRRGRVVPSRHPMTLKAFISHDAHPVAFRNPIFLGHFDIHKCSETIQQTNLKLQHLKPALIPFGEFIGEYL